MLKPLLAIIICLTVNALSFAQNEVRIDQPPVKRSTFIVDDTFKKSDLLGYIYAFSTANSSLTVGDVISHPTGFRLLDREIPHFGGDNRYHWIRTDIENGASRPGQLISYMHFNEMTDLCFYVVNEKNEIIYKKEHFSQRTYINKKPIPTRYFAFPVDLPAGGKVTTYWRVYRAENSVITPLRLYTKDSFDSFLRTYDSLAFLCLGVIFSAFLLSLILFFINKSKVLFYYAGYSLFYFLLCITNDGIVLQYFHIDPFDIALGTRLIVTGFTLFFLVQFSQYFLDAPKIFRPSYIKFNDYLSYTLLVFGIVIAVFSLDDRFSSFFYLLCLVVMVSICVMVAIGMFGGKREAFIYFIAAGPFFLSCIWYALIILFNTPATWFFFTSNLVIPVIEMVVLGAELGNKLIRERDKYFSGLNELQRELTSSILKAQDAERRRIAADLHDELGGTLATIRLKFASLKRSMYLKENLEQPSMQVVEDIEPLIQKTSNDLRRISQTLMPPEFERIGLLASVHHVVNSLPGPGSKFRFLTAGESRKMYTEKELAVYRITAEAIQYASRREFVSRGSVQLLYCDEHLRVVIEADEKIEAVSLTEERVRKDLLGCSLLATYLDGSFYVEVSHSGIFIIAEIPY
jgi:signal transduction histidine kinase